MAKTIQIKFRALQCISLLAIAMCPLQLPAADLRPLTLNDRGQFDSIGGISINNNGSAISYVLNDRIYVWQEADNSHRAITPESFKASQPRWSQNADAIYFVSDQNDASQLWRVEIDDVDSPQQLSTFKHGVHSTHLSADDKYVLLSFSDNEITEKDSDESPKPYVVTRRQFKVDEGQGYVVAGDESHLYIFHTETDVVLPLTDGPFDENYPAWSPDGRSVAFVSNRDDDRDINYSADIWLVDTADRKPASPKRLTDNDRTKHSPAWSPDGETIAYISARDGVYGLQHIAVVPASGGEPRLLTESLDRWIHSFAFSGDSRWIYFNYDEDGSTRLARVSLDDSRIEKLLDNDVVVHSFDVADNGALALLLQEADSTTNLYHWADGNLEQLTDTSRALLDSLQIAAKQSVHYGSTDGTTIQAFITTPPDYDAEKRYPAILLIHGGPVMQFAWGYDFRSQYLATRGYVVIEPNPRGSTGQGQDFIHAVYATWGVTEYPDVMNAVDYAIEHGFAEPNNLFVTGYSYGGYMTNVLISETDRFAAAASGAGHSLIEANLGHDIYQQWYTWELGVPWENREGYERMSPLLRAGNVTTPTIFLGGSHDWNVPILNSELFYQALRMKGVDSQLIVYPDAHHGGWPDAFENDYWQRVLEWFETYKNEPDE